MSLETPRSESARTLFSRVVSDDSHLWLVTLLALVLDVATTMFGLSLGLSELNPVVLALMPQFGALGTLLLLKSVVLLISGTMWVFLPVRYRGAIPIGVAVPWGVAGLMNAQLILLTSVG
ncbi:hypothetical protein [Haloferax larsenii]|uniref:DUF5658 domain-containing protein n=1 Tax=Haloferax larsenii TaxID=302484 RepID=A0A1H7JCG6_HALLR|nr:hypothetical protein [Haloferax larsenii]SEK71670.1 hypothetical protein SAMN04488691_1011146 [Haloferax larsenii]